jgi:S-formylglutathione hydrolase FrmB
MKNLISGVFLCFFFRLIFCAAAATAQDSRIELRSFPSTVLGISKSYNIYLPKDYDKSTERYPVIYLFRGHENEWADPTEDGSRQGKTAKDDADAVIAAGAMGNVILVMPGMSSTDGAVLTCGVNMLNLALASTRDGLGTGRFEDYLVKELIPFVDNNFRTIPSRWFRAVDGFSLGGQTSMMIATKHPELFCSAGAFDGTLMWLDFKGPSPTGAVNDLWVTNSMFDPLFNKPRDIAYMTQYNASNIVNAASPALVSALKQMQFLFHATPNGNDDRTNALIALLAAKGIPNGFPIVNITPTAQHNWYYADMHAMQTFPKHWEKFRSPIASLYCPFAGPAPASVVSGTVPLAWLRGGRDSAVTLLQASSNGGTTWQTLKMSTARDSVYQWDTRTMADGTRYLLRLLIIADSSIGVSQSAGRFTVNNPGNAAPDVEVLSPSANDTVRTTVSIRWNAADADGDSLRIAIDFSADNGITWKTLASSLPNSGVYVWNSAAEVNSAKSMLRIRATDGTAETTLSSGVFTVLNKRFPIFPFIVHRSGAGDGTITVVHVDASPLLTIPYRIKFYDSTGTGGTGTYYTVDKFNGTVQVVPKTLVVNGLEGPYFDGFRLIITTYPVPQPMADSIRWIMGTSRLEGSVSLPEINLSTGLLKGVPYPADYVVTTADRVMDTSSAFLDAVPSPMKFTVWNRTENRRAEVIYNDNDNDASISRNDELYILEKDSKGAKELTWQVMFTANDTYVKPAAGDQFLIKIAKPITSADVFEFVPSIDGVQRTTAVPGTWHLGQNFPNPFNPTTRIRFTIAQTQTVRLAVFDILGREAATLVNERMQPGTYSIEWNAKNFASGVYFYRLTAGCFSETKKLVLTR